jgi:hypothetical protein
MKFEEVMPVWRSGSKVRRKGMSWYLSGKLCLDASGEVTEPGDILVAHLLADDWEVVDDYEDVEVWDWVVWGDGPLAEVHRGKTNAEMQWVIWRSILPCKMAELEGTQRIERRRK